MFIFVINQVLTVLNKPMTIAHRCQCPFGQILRNKWSCGYPLLLLAAFSNKYRLILVPSVSFCVAMLILDLREKVIAAR